MGLNIKNPEAHKLATELAELTGESLTDAVTIALRERLQREVETRQDSREQLKKDVLEILARIHAGIKGPGPDHGDFLYDERGLPK